MDLLRRVVLSPISGGLQEVSLPFPLSLSLLQNTPRLTESEFRLILILILIETDATGDI